MLEHLARAIGRAGDGVVHHGGADARAALDQPIHAVDQAAAAGHDDAVSVEVAHKLGRRALEHAVDGLEDAVHRLHEGLDGFVCADADGLGHAAAEIAAVHFLHAHVRPLEHAADIALDLLRGGHADEHVVLAADVLDDGLVKARARDLDRLALDHAAGGDDRDFRGAAADVDDHMALGSADIHAGAERGGDRGLEQIDLTGAGLDGGVDHGALFHAGDAAGNAGEHAGLEQAEGGHAADKLPLHLRGQLIVRDDAVCDRVDGHDVGRRAAQHLLCLLSDLHHLAVDLVHGHHGRFPGDHALALDIDQGSRGPHIDGNVAFKYLHIESPQCVICRESGCRPR